MIEHLLRANSIQQASTGMWDADKPLTQCITVHIFTVVTGVLANWTD